jgi:2,3-bisphosphoglycerate-independent phosphoglycerate mutase
MQKRLRMLVILDGWGINNKIEGNAIAHSKVPNFENYWTNYPHTLLSASGLDVGLPRGQMGNSEVGHMNIGSGRIIYQELTRINKAIEDGDFFSNEAFLNAINHARENSTSVHLMGLFSDGGVHSHIEHIEALLKLCKEQGVDNVFVHSFLDGRDVPPQSALDYIDRLEACMKNIGLGKIATISGRYYAMDRDKRWDRTELAYNAIVKGQGKTSSTAREAVEASYKLNQTDEFVLPTVIMNGNEPTGTITENDSVIFFNFRPDRARQMTRALVDGEFSVFQREYIKLHFVTMTQYDKTIENVTVAYKPQSYANTLGEYISKRGYRQLRIAETEKYAHVTFFFNGGVEAPNTNEERILIPSPKVPTYDLQPEMSAYAMTDKVLEEIENDKHDVIVLNYANPDMVGHTGIFQAAITAVETVDKCLGKVVNKVLEKGGALYVTADHGNADQMVDYESGDPLTSHTTNLVPFLMIGEGNVELREEGRLSDIAPTMLELMNLEIPAEMTGKSLIKK